MTEWIELAAATFIGAVVIGVLISATTGLAGPFEEAHQVAAMVYDIVPVLSALSVLLFAGWLLWSGVSEHRRRQRRRR